MVFILKIEARLASGLLLVKDRSIFRLIGLIQEIGILVEVDIYLWTYS